MPGASALPVRIFSRRILMKSFPFKKIDAFASENSGGNPAGCIYLSSPDEISAAEKLQIAGELKGFVSEVAYISQKAEDSFDLSYYSSEREVEFCGHATIAVMYDLVTGDASLKNLETLKITTRRGDLPVQNRVATENAVFIMAPKPFEKKELPPMDDVARSLGLSEDEICVTMPPAIINAGLSTLLVEVKNLELILGLHPEFNSLKSFCERSGIDIIEVFTADVAASTSDFRVRVFAPTFGYLEDPATGSGNSALGYYLTAHNMFDKQTLVIEQNSQRENYNIVKLQKMRDDEGNVRILFGGGAVRRIEGKYLLQ